MRLIWSIAFSLMLLSSCSNELIYEYPIDYEGTYSEVENFKLVTYNIHGGHGPNGEGDLSSNLMAFKDLLANESIVCLQEVVPEDWNTIKSIFPSYEYRYYLPQQTTKFGCKKQGGNAILSKLPIESYDQALIQTDPGGDKWERKAQYISVRIGFDKEVLHLFHYHNTYNWHDNDSQSEKAGMEKFKDFVLSKNISNTELIVLAGDFNLTFTYVSNILPQLLQVSNQSNWVDHIFTNGSLVDRGRYPTVEQMLSDHWAVWSVVCNLDC